MSSAVNRAKCCIAAMEAATGFQSSASLVCFFCRGAPLQLDLAACRGVTGHSLTQLLPAGCLTEQESLALFVSTSGAVAPPSVPEDSDNGTAIAADSITEPTHAARRLSQVRGLGQCHRVLLLEGMCFSP
jgi:hypothetical protein